MSGRVLSTETAQQSITKMKQIISGGLIDQIEALNREGKILSDPNVWDGQLALKFRGSWEKTYKALQNAQRELEELRASVDKINKNIITAGGGS